jgi:signal transduction histidine kinase
VTGRRLSIPVVVLLTSLFLSAVGTWVIASGAKERDLARFANATESARDRLEQRLDVYTALLLTGVGLFVASENVTIDEFQAFTEAIDLAGRFQGIQGIGFTLRIAPEDTAAIVAQMRSGGRPDFRIWPDSARSEYHSIIYLQPLDESNALALGYDMFTDSTRREAMERARDTGQPALSGKVTLVQEIGDNAQQAGFLIYAPLYETGVAPGTVQERRDALRGYVYAPFRAEDMFSGIFGTEAQPRVAFDIYDGPRPTPEGLLHTSANFGTRASPSPQVADTTSIAVAGHEWTFVFTPTLAFEAGSRQHLIPLFAGLGTLVSLTLFGLTYLEMRSTREAEEATRRAEQFSRKLSEQALALEAQIRAGNALNEKLAEANAGLVAAHTAMEAARDEAEEARAQADQANRAKSQFLTKMSHELRTPLNAIAGYVDLLQLEIRGSINDSQRKYLGRISHAQQHLLGLINDVLSFAKLEVGKVHYQIEDVDLERVLDDLDGLIVPLAAAKGISYRRISSDETRIVRADREKLLQVLLNLLSNAVKFTATGGSVMVSSSLTDGEVAVRVEDSGRGIPSDQIRAVFEPFVQVSNDLTREDEGTGLGLTIANELAQAMGGTLVAESALGVGSTFTLMMPAGRSANV